VIGLLAVGLGAAPAASANQTPTSSLPAQKAALWLADQVGPDGTATSPFSAGAVDISSTVDIAMSLAATGVDQAAFERAMGWIVANASEVISPPDEPSNDDVLGVLLMLAAASGTDPTQFGGVDLLEALSSSLGLVEPGLYGSGDPTFDGVFRQSLALLGLVAVGETPPSAAVDWLVAQRCVPGDGDPLADGGWMAYRDVADPCTAPDPTGFSGADNDSTSLAIMALAALSGYTAEVADGIDFLSRGQDATGGFAWFSGGEPVPNTTSLVVAAIVSTGDDPTTGQWVRDGVDPVQWMVDQQIPCGEPDAGALVSIYSDGGPDQFATRYSVYGLGMVSFPLSPVTFANDLAPCGELPPPIPPDDPAEPVVEPTVVPTPAAQPALIPAATPRFTG